MSVVCPTQLEVIKDLQETVLSQDEKITTQGANILKLSKRIAEQEEMIQKIAKYVSDLSDLVGGDPGPSGVTAREILGNILISPIIFLC